MKYEKTQKGNPHELTIKQHIFPEASIKRFQNQRGFIEVYIKAESKKVPLKPGNDIFCAKRVWDQRAEKGYMKGIEDAFQSLAEKILKKEINYLNYKNNIKALGFSALWRFRYHHFKEPIDDVVLQGIDPGDQLTKDQEEIIEKQWSILAKNKNSKAIIPSRFINGTNIQASIDRILYSYKDLTWEIVESLKSEFIVPDTFSDLPIIPITPKIILLGGYNN